jgi:hypothetical protein
VRRFTANIVARRSVCSRNGAAVVSIRRVPLADRYDGHTWAIAPTPGGYSPSGTR